MKALLRSATILLTLGVPAVLIAQSQSSLLVLSKHDHTLSIVDSTTLRVLSRLPVGDDPHEVIASSDGATAYVSNYGFGAFHTLAVIDLVHAKPLPSIDLGALRGPHGLTFVDGKVWFTAEAAKSIGRYDPVTQQIDFIMGTGQNRTHMIDVSPDAKHIATSNVSSGTISLIDLEPLATPTAPRPSDGKTTTPRVDWVETVIPVGRGAEGFDISPDRREIWAANAQDGTISVIDYPAKKVTATLSANVQTANRLKFTPDGKRVLISTAGAPDLVILDTATRKVIQRLPIGKGAAGILIEPNGNRAFVACSPNNDVAVIDLHTLTVIHRIDAGGEPDGLAWATRP